MSTEMPLARYFAFVGATLIALLFVADAYLPKLPDAPATTTATDLSVIRIHSDRKLPDRVVFDTSIPTIAPAQTVMAQASVATPAKADGTSANARTRDAFAQLTPSDLKNTDLKSSDVKSSDVKTAELKTTDTKKPDQPQPRKRKVAKKHVGPPTMLVAQQPQFGWFATKIW
jgi:hypothetical protein